MSWSAEFSWTNPTQVITPTNTQVRMLNPVSLWATLAYPMTGIVWGGLASSTDYEFQVRLIRVVDGLVTHFSPARSYEFTTPVSVVPVVDGDGDVIFPTPGGGCTLEWELQESDDGTTWATIDDGTDSSPPWTIDIDFGTLDAEKLYRVRSREMCPGAGAWFYSDVFGPACTTPPAVGDPPFDDALGYLPGLCPPDIIVETVSDSTAIHAPSWGTVEVDGDGNIVLVSSTQGPVVFNVNTPATDGLTGDASLNIRVNLSTQPDAATEVGLLQWAGLTIAVVEEGAGFKMRGKAHEEGAGVTSVTDGTELDLNTWYDLTLTHDVAAGDLRLYVDGIEVSSALGSVGARHDSGLYVLENAAASRSTNAAIWDRVLDLSVAVTINQGSGQADPATGSSVVFDVVFAEAVSGFATGDVTLSGTAGGTLVGTVAGSGTTYTVTVTGMTTAGTIIASIAAAVCVATSDGRPNGASTSTDNTVTWSLFPATGLWAWYDASDATTITATSGRVDQFNDKSGNGRHLTSSGSNRPFTGRTLNSKAVLDFQAAQYMNRAAAIGFGIGQHTIFVVAGEDTSIDNAGFLALHHSSGNDYDTTNAVVLNASASNRQFSVDNNSISVQYAGAGSAVPTPIGTWTNSKNTGTNKWQLTAPPAQSSSGSQATNAAAGTANGGILIGGRYISGAISGSFRLDGPIAEILIYSVELSSGDITAVRNYLTAKWGN